jgi:hypothetical protein
MIASFLIVQLSLWVELFTFQIPALLNINVCGKTPLVIHFIQSDQRESDVFRTGSTR